MAKAPPEIPQLRVRTEYSYRQTFGPLGDVARALEAIGSPAAGMVDPGTWGHAAWGKALKKTAVRPMFGVEVVVPDAQGRKPVAWALAEDTRAFYRFSSGVLAPDADVHQMLAEARGVIRFAGAALADPAEFDYIDINPASPLQQSQALALHKRTRKPLVITSDNYFPDWTDCRAFLAVGGRARSTPQHILSREKLKAALSCLPARAFNAAAASTQEVAERAAGTLPQASIIQVEGDLRALAADGQARRLRLGHIAAWTQEYEDRLQRELKAIEAKNYQSYFLVVAELIAWAKERMLVGPGRGSSAGSLLCYLTAITEVDPIQHSLLFERFIDVSRDDLPDIDIDFSDARRELCFEHLREKYGAERVARIGSINRLGAKSVIARVCEKMAIPDREKFDVMNVLIDYSSGDSRYGHALEDTMAQTEPGKRFMQAHPEAAVVFRLENHASHTGVHAAGVIVCNEPIAELCTVGADGVIQGDKKYAEDINLLKIDALGLRTLGIIEDTGCVTGDELFALKLDDPKVFDLLNAGKYAGVFQFEGQAQRRVSAEIDITSFRVMDHLTALARPGPLGGGATGHYTARAAGREPVTYRHPSMESYLSPTMGVVLYQEQVMRIVREMGQFSWEETTAIRKAMSGRKGKEFFDQQLVQFRTGAAKVGVSEEDAEAIWAEICTFGAWGMNACAAESTRIKLCHPNQFLGPAPTIAELYRHYKAEPSSWIRQRNVMPTLMCVGEDGVARPTMAVDIIHSGRKACVRLTFEDGRTVECTKDHRFVIDGAWRQAGTALPGATFADCARQAHVKNHSFNLGAGHGWRKGRSGAGPDDQINGRDAFARNFRTARATVACEDCSELKTRMEVHHNDHQHGKLRPEDMAWLCRGCHRQRHVNAGDWLPPYAQGWAAASGAKLVSVEPVGTVDTYDIEMPAPHHNFLLANGIVTHNSHTTSYAVISYWCVAGRTRLYDWDKKVYVTVAKAFSQGVKHIACYDERTGQTVKGLVKKIIRTTGAKFIDKKPGWTLKTRSGRSLICSADHKILTPDGYKRLNELAVGDLIATERRCPVDSVERRNAIAAGVKAHWAKLDDEDRSERTAALTAGLTAETRAASAKKGWVAMDGERRRDRVQKFIESAEGGQWAARSTGNVAACGHRFASSNERYICEWLNSRGIDHDSQVWNGKGFADWKAKGVYIEYDGVGRSESYFENKYGDDAYVVLRNRSEVEEKLGFLLEEELLRVGGVVTYEPIASITAAGDFVMYDVVMEDNPHNFLANEIVVHNCAWMKVYHPLEYAASCLRHAKDDDQAYELLREWRGEGIEHVAFDPELSDVDWAAVDGKLIGGFMNLAGYGPAKSAAAVEARAQGMLDLEKVGKAQVKFRELFPINTAYAGLYADPESYGCQSGSHVIHLNELPPEGNVLFIGKILRKELRDENETVRLARRDGRRIQGQSLFLDVFVTDDTGIPVTLRIGRKDYDRIGKMANELLQPGDVMLIRGRRVPNFAMVHALRLRVLNREVNLNAQD